jgi:hypothetical protein
MNISAHDTSEILTAIYEIDGPESLARHTAERICLDQTIEAENNLLPPSLQFTIVGRIEDLQATVGGRYHATIRFPTDLLSGECSDMLNIVRDDQQAALFVAGATIWDRWTQADGRRFPSPFDLRRTQTIRPHSSGTR